MKYEYPALLEPGIHDIPLSEFSERFVEPFPDPDRRKSLLDNFQKLMQFVENTGLRAEVWVGGSFLTEKPDPADIDCVVLCDVEQTTLTEGISVVYERLRNHRAIKMWFGCDLQILTPTEDDRMYWRGVWGFDRQNKPRGFACFRIGTP